MKTAKLAKTKHIVDAIMAATSRFGASSRIGSTPGGGVAAGPFKSASSCAGVEVVDISLI